MNESAIPYLIPLGSGQARSTAPSHSTPQELGRDEYLYEPIYDPTSTATPTTATPTFEQEYEQPK